MIKAKYKQQDRQCMYKQKKLCSHNYCCHGKAVSISNSECMSVAFVVPHAKHTYQIKVSFVASLNLPNLTNGTIFGKKLPNLKCVFVVCGLSKSTKSHKWHDFWKKVTELKMCVLIFSTTFVQNVSHYKSNSIRYKFMCLHVKYITNKYINE